MDYQGNSKKSKEVQLKPDKKVEKVVTGEVKTKAKPLGRKVKDVFVSADFRSVATYVAADVLLPALRNMIVDASTKGIERMMYGESASRRRGYSGSGPRVTYNNPISRNSQYVGSGPGSRHIPDPRVRRASQDDLILSSREEAEQVLSMLNDIIDQYEQASVADLNDLVGLPTSHVDNKWGWSYLGNADVRQLRDGYLINLPPAEPI